MIIQPVEPANVDLVCVDGGTGLLMTVSRGSHRIIDDMC